MVVAGACGTGAFLALYLFFRLSGVLSGHWRMILLALSLAGTVVPMWICRKAEKRWMSGAAAAR